MQIKKLHHSLPLVTRAVLALAVMVTLLPLTARADDNTVTFLRTDNPGNWFSNTAGPIAGTQSLAVASPGVQVRFKDGESAAVHTVTSLIFPTGAVGMPFDSGSLQTNDQVRLTLTTPGLYVFTCKIHPFMFAAVIVDDPKTPGLDLGDSITLVTGVTVPTSSDLATRLLRTFFIATNPANWQDHTLATWHITYPSVNVRITGGAVVNLADVLNARYGNDLPMTAAFNPATPGVGEVWVDTEFELTKQKHKPGSATHVDATSWLPVRKVFLPQIDMNNPHNMWTDQNQTVIYQTQWFDFRLTTFNRTSGQLLHDIQVGADPSHVMTRTDTDHLHVALDGTDSPFAVVQLNPGGGSIERLINIEEGHPHAHWMGHDGKTMVTPNTFSDTSTIFDFNTDSVRALVHTTGALPIATGMMPDDSKYYITNFLDSTVDVVNTQTGAITKTISLLANYDPISGAITGPVGALPIQTPVSPDGKVMVTANILTDTITLIDTKTDTLVAMLPCDAGCHGVQWGAKKGGGYYAYVSSQFSNTFQIVDPNPDGSGDLTHAAIVGRILLKSLPSTAVDDKIVGLNGMGGQGVLAIPVVYNGWVQNLPAAFKQLLTPDQLNPFPTK
ncbi:MAG TPA: beta-propeller fold lactonase family protein [Candidatus Angelobacter sp.]|nr:beta-propeller fold lactonase family protein [Candidatus Angelobacter sp.]